MTEPASAADTHLTVERLFGDPPLAGRLPTNVGFSPDGRQVTYLMVAQDDRERLDLWCYPLDEGAPRELVNAASLIDADRILTDAEKAERERRRQFARGITSYLWLPDNHRLVLPVDGQAHVYDLADARLDRLTPIDTHQTDFTVSPCGTWLSYVRGGNLYALDLASRDERQITDGADEQNTFGIADFIAQEEMHRFAGHWWSPDEQWLAYVHNDVSPIDVTYRYEIDADAFNVVEQRYPYAGEANARVSLLLRNMTDGTVRTLDWQETQEDYLARVDVVGHRLVVQVQSRDQTGLSVRLYDLASHTWTTAFRERSETWINLHDNLFELPDGGGFLWTSERNGHVQLFAYRFDTAHLEEAGPAAGRINQVLAAEGDRVWVSAWFDDPTEQHLYRLGPRGQAPVRLTEQPGWHQLWADRSGEHFASLHSALDRPPGLTLLDRHGQIVADITDGRIGREHPYRAFQHQHVTPKLGVLTAEDGASLWYRVTPPTRIRGLHPLVVYVYGGPGPQLARNEWAPLLRQLFAGHGFGMIEIDNRGSGNRTPDFEAPIHGRLGRVEVIDQLAGVRHLCAHETWVDPERIGVFGHSYGGYMALMCLCTAPDVFKAGVAVAPVSDWRLYDTHYTERYLGRPQDNAEGYRQSGVLPHLDKLTGRLMLIHGMADDNVLFTQSTRIIKTLQTLKTPFEMMAYPGSKHALQEPTVSVHRFNLILDFLNRSL